MLAAMYLGYARVTAPLPERKGLLGVRAKDSSPSLFILHDKHYIMLCVTIKIVKHALYLRHLWRRYKASFC